VSSTYVRISVGGEYYALPVEEVIEVDEIGDVTPVPGAAAGVLGVRNLRGQILPVVELASVLGIPGERSTRHLVVAEQAGRRIGLAVDELQDVGSLPEASEKVDSRYLDAASVVDGALVGRLDAAAVIDYACALERSSDGRS
jgi:purine-binding chemotaxis protein CheW